MRDVVSLPKCGATLAPPSSGGKQSPADLTPKPAELRARPRVAHDHPRVPGSPSPFSRWVPAPPPETRSFSFNAALCKGVRSRPAPPASFSTSPFPLPSEFQVNGSRREEAATLHLHLRRTRRTAGRAGQSVEEPVPGTAGGVARAGPSTSRSPAWHWCACSGAGRPGWGGVGGPKWRRRRAESPSRSWGERRRSAQRQVRPPGERAPRLPPSWEDLVGRLGCCELVRVGRGARGARYPGVPAGTAAPRSGRGSAGEGRSGLVSVAVSPGTGTRGNRGGAGARSEATVDAAPRSRGHLEAPISLFGGNALLYLCPGADNFSLFGGGRLANSATPALRSPGCSSCGFSGEGRGALSPRVGAMGALAGQGA